LKNRQTSLQIKISIENENKCAFNRKFAIFNKIGVPFQDANLIRNPNSQHFYPGINGGILSARPFPGGFHEKGDPVGGHCAAVRIRKKDEGPA
jgi:hypothetical protein